VESLGILGILAPAASVGVLVAVSLLEERSEGGADGAAAEGLLHAEVVHHALLYFLLSRGEEEAPEDRQLHRGAQKRRKHDVKKKSRADRTTCDSNPQSVLL